MPEINRADLLALADLLLPRVADELERRAPREAMTADQVAAFLGVDRKTVYDHANRGAIPHRRLGKRLLFSRSAIVAWLGSCKAASIRRG